MNFMLVWNLHIKYLIKFQDDTLIYANFVSHKLPNGCKSKAIKGNSLLEDVSNTQKTWIGHITQKGSLKKLDLPEANTQTHARRKHCLSACNTIILIPFIYNYPHKFRF